MRNIVSLLFLWMLSIPSAYAFQDAYGEPIAWEGKWKVVNYWAEWCTPCRREIPEFNHLAKELKEQKILVIGINYDNLKNETLIQALKNLDISFPVLDSNSAIKAQLPQPIVLPTTYILTTDDKIVSTLVGEQTKQSINKTLVDLINSAKSSSRN